MSLLELENVYKAYQQGGGLLGGQKTVEVLKGVSLAVEPGQCLGLLGASGCGKSTAGRLLLGLERPDRGRVLYRGRDLRTLSGEARRQWRRNCQVVFQNSHGAVNPRRRAWEIVSEPLSNFGAGGKGALRSRAAELLEKVGLDERDLNKLPHQFSGGELQRVCIARALALNPEFILLDEAVSSLDMHSQSRVLDLLATLKRDSGAAFVFISHDVRVLLKMADSLAVLSDGRLASETDPAFHILARAVPAAEPAVFGVDNETAALYGN